MSLIIQQWEKDRAQRAVELMREVVTRGVTGAEDLPALLEELDPAGDVNLRRAVYGMLGALEVVPPWELVTNYQNNWASLGGTFDPHPSITIDRGMVRWRGLVGRSSGAAVNGEVICYFPKIYTPAKGSANLCITDSGSIRIDIDNNGPDGMGRLRWRTTGGYTGGYAYVFLNNIDPYDLRG